MLSKRGQTSVSSQIRKISVSGGSPQSMICVATQSAGPKTAGQA
jgi:hypothetical protein